MNWNDLSMIDRATLIKLGVASGLYNVQDIKKAYNESQEYKGGGCLRKCEDGGFLFDDSNDFKSGGKIHIKKENRGKFTALLKRTGKPASWFKAHGTPAQRKMATFALNARKWKHEDGGPLVQETTVVVNPPSFTANLRDNGTPLQQRLADFVLNRSQNTYKCGGKVSTKHKYDEGGYTEASRPHREYVHNYYDPTGGYGFLDWVATTIANQNGKHANHATGEADDYWRAYLGLDNYVPAMNPNAKTEWDDVVEAKKLANGELPSEFYGTTPTMDKYIQLMADTLTLGKLARDYNPEEDKYGIGSQKFANSLYLDAKKVLDNPGEWQQVNGNTVGRDYNHIDIDGEYDPLGMLQNYGLKWVPEEKALYMHDTYDFPSYVTKLSKIPVRPREMKIRAKIGFDPLKGSKISRE